MEEKEIKIILLILLVIFIVVLGVIVFVEPGFINLFPKEGCEILGF